MRSFFLFFALLISSTVFSQQEDKRLAALLRPYLEKHHGIAGIYVQSPAKEQGGGYQCRYCFPYGEYHQGADHDRDL